MAPRQEGLTAHGRDDLIRSDLPLVLLSAPAASRSDGVQPIDRVRMQKAVFLLTVAGPEAWSSLYPFKPYNWGPYCTLLARDLDDLRCEGLVRLAAVPDHRYRRYTLTATGQDVADVSWHQLSRNEQSFVQQVHDYVTSRDFSRLLTDVYNAFPEYATESHFRPWRAT